MYTTALTYDDIQLIPQFSDIESRSEVNLTTQLSRNYTIDLPFVASPMDTVCESEMAIELMTFGGVGCIHRFMSIADQAREVASVYAHARHLGSLGKVPIMAAVGANGDFLERTKELSCSGANIILIDVAHGYHKFVKDAIKELKYNLPSHIDIIAGNVATGDAAFALEEWGADAVRVGVGGGAMCTTRVKTGFGVPNITSIGDCANQITIPIIADGGIRNSGDIAKALAVGASSVMLGSLLAGTSESPGKILETPNGLFKRYRGAASLDTKTAHGQSTRNVEGESTIVPFKGGVKFVIEGLTDGLRSALSYGGARNIKTFRPDHVVVTNAGIAEAKPHGVR